MSLLRSKRVRRIGSILLFVLFLLVLAAAGHPPQSTGTLYKVAAGPQKVEEARELILHDARRNKDLQIRVHFPAEAGSYPVIAFSHGAGGSKECCTELVRHWASHGYVVIQMTHADSLRLRREQGDRTPVTQALTGAVRQLGQPANRQGRTDDVKLVLDSLAEIERLIPTLKGKLDSSRIGVGGHSAGALTSQLLGGAKIFGRGDPDHTDPRPKAFLLLSPQGRGSRLGFTEDSWKTFARPMMVMTGSLDTGAAGERPEWRRDPYDLAPAGGKYLVFIDGAHHGSFVGNLRGGALETLRGSSAPPVDLADQQRIFDWIQSAAIAFWDAHLKNDPAAAKFLASDALVTNSTSRVEFRNK